MRHRYLSAHWPAIWLISDPRIDDRLEAAIDRLPRGSGLIVRHYDAPDRHARFRTLARRARRRGHVVVLAGSAAEARRWGADGAYGSPERLAAGPAMLRLVTVHSLRELRQADRADAVLLSPVFATRTHPGAGPLGAIRFRLLAAHARVPVIALGGMDARRARAIGATHWAAIESLAQPPVRVFPIHS